MRSMKGTTMFRPGASVAWYLPSRSTTQACCWGTTLMVLKTNTSAMMKMTSATVPNENSMCSPDVIVVNRCCGSRVGDDQPAAQHLDDAKLGGVRRRALPQLHIP